MIQYLGVTKEYSHGMNAIKDISFEVSEGEFLFLVGPSGSGKTTLIKMLIREETPTSGKIFFHDDDITRFKQKQIYQLRRKIGVIFQDYKLIPELTAYENIAFAMEVAGRSDKDVKENVPYLLDIVGLNHRAKYFPRQLSGGEKQRVAIARSIANNPSVLLADEPTGNLDPESAWDIVQILNKINNWGTTIIMSTHGSDIVNTLHKRVIKMADGQLIRDDLKGGYEELDDFSMKIISTQQQAAENMVIKTQPQDNTKKDERVTTDTPTNDSVIDDIKKSSKNDEPEENGKIEDEEIKSEDIKSNIKPDTKNNIETFENQILSDIDSDKLDPLEVKSNENNNLKNKPLEKALLKTKPTKLKQYKKKIQFSTKKKNATQSKNKEVKQSDLDLPTNLVKKLQAVDIHSLNDLQEIGIKDLSKLDGFSKKDINKIKLLLN